MKAKKKPAKAPATKKKASKPKAAPKAKVAKQKNVKAKPAATPKAPAPVKSLMSKSDLKYFENLISEKRESIQEELGTLEKSLTQNTKDSTGDLSSYSFHMADQATDSEEKEHTFRLAERESAFLHHLEEALYRIKQGTFGVCRACGKLIGKERLEAVPHATMCIKCKEADQERKRREGDG